jgi:membrane protein CcdC involved in cytochrome C biogenesis
MTTLVVSVIVFVMFGVGVLLVTFITWSLPTISINWLLLSRLAISIGAVRGIMFIFSEEGRDVSEDIAKDLWKGLLK